jgi:hypothetical protein
MLVFGRVSSNHGEFRMNKIVASAIVVSLFALAGCARDASPVKGPDGQEWVAISCSHDARGCWQKAGEFCPTGYEVADEVQSTHGFLLFKHQKEEMLIRCKAAEVAVVALPPHALGTSH